jgi:hypothetical protein
MEDQAPDLASALSSWASSSPLTTALVALAIGWAVTNYLVRGPTSLRTGGTHDSAREDAVRAARERQQIQLAEAAERRAGRGGQVAQTLATNPDADTQPEDKPVMPARMAAAMRRREESAGAGSSCGCVPPASDVPAADASAAAAPTPAPAPKRRADDPNSITQRLARIERGKGPSDHNPLHGHASGSSAGSSFQCKKKGG